MLFKCKTQCLRYYCGLNIDSVWIDIISKMWTHIATLGRDIYKYITFLKSGWRFDLCSIKSQPLEISLDVTFKPLIISLLLKLCNCRDLMSVCGGRTLGFWPSLENWRHTNAFYKLSEILLCCHFFWTKIPPFFVPPSSFPEQSSESFLLDNNKHFTTRFE